MFHTYHGRHYTSSAIPLVSYARCKEPHRSSYLYLHHRGCPIQNQKTDLGTAEDLSLSQISFVFRGDPRVFFKAGYPRGSLLLQPLLVHS